MIAVDLYVNRFAGKLICNRLCDLWCCESLRYEDLTCQSMSALIRILEMCEKW